MMTTAQAREVIALCSEIFNVDYAHLMDLCPVRTHVLGYEDGELVAHALWLDRPLRPGTGPWLDAAYVEGVATRADRRSHGYASAVMRMLQSAIRRYDLGALSPAVEKWYARMGWERWLGPLFIEKNGEPVATPHETLLIYRTPRTGALDMRAPMTAPWRPFAWW